MIRSVLSLSCVVFVDGVSYLPGYRLIYIPACTRRYKIRLQGYHLQNNRLLQVGR
jgi:hypothetical protein